MYKKTIYFILLNLLTTNFILGQFENYYQIIKRRPEIRTELLDGKVKITNLYKQQIKTLYENRNLSKDSIIEIYVKEIYIPYKEVWGSFFDERGFRVWLKNNWKILNNPNHKGIKLPFEINFDSVFREVGTKLFNLTDRKPSGNWCLFYGTGGDMGGLNNGIMFANLIQLGKDKEYLEFILPHEMNHQIFDFTNHDEDILLRRIINEGLACYINNLYWNNKYSPAKCIGFEKKEWNWALKNEIMIYNQFMKDYETKDDSIILKYSSWHQYIWKNSPDRIAYFIGYRIIEAYINKHGKDSWKELYEMPIRDILKQSNYEVFINRSK